MSSSLEEVMTTKEASEKYFVADSTIRSWIKNNEFLDQEYKKSGNTWIIIRQGIERVLKEKGMLYLRIKVGKQFFTARHLNFKDNGIQGWLQDDDVKKIMDNFEYQTLVAQVLKELTNDEKLKYKYLIITNEKTVSVNDYYKNKLWVLSIKTIVDIVRLTIKRDGFDTANLDEYAKNNEIKVL